MINKALLTFLLCGLCDGVTREYHFIGLTKSWTEAQLYCRQHYTDLATVTNMEEVNRLNRTSPSSGLVWIGLFDDPASWRNVGGNDSNSWRWSVTGTTSTSKYENWAGVEPDYRNMDTKCVSVSYDGAWFDFSCSDTYFFVCYNGSTNKVFHLVNTSSTWDQARAYCRANYTDLAVIESAAENSQVASLIKSTYYWAWIGLYREPWRWSDNTVVSFTNWGDVGNYITDYNCAAEDTNHSWYPQTCDQRLPFFCYKGVTREYHFIDQTKSWTEAQQYCRQYYTDLATVTNMDEVNRLIRPSSSSGKAWIGLFDDPASWRNIGGTNSNSWRWSVTGTTSPSKYENWARFAPNHWSFEEKCVLVFNDGVWFNFFCFLETYFVCYEGSKDKVFHLVNTSSTWDQARAYCRANYTDLAVIESAAENSQVASLIQSASEYSYAWIGLYREPWRWSDNTTSSFTNWGDVENDITDSNCAAKDTDHSWYPQTCDQRLPFFCYKERKPPVMRIQFVKRV